METLNQEQVLEEVLVDEWYDTEKEKPIFFFIKRCIDIILSLLGLIILSPVFLLIAILIINSNLNKERRSWKCLL